MAQGMNRLQLMGRMGADPEVRYTGAGKAVATCSVATTETWKDAQGAKQERTDWHRVTLWGKPAEWVGANVMKGALVYVEARVQYEKYEDKKHPGVMHYATNIVADRFDLLRPPGTAKQDPGRPVRNQGDAGFEPPPSEFTPHAGPSDNDIPF